MKSSLIYEPETDMLLTMFVSTSPSTSEGTEVAPGVIMFVNEEDQIIGFEIDNASKRVDLSDIEGNPEVVFSPTKMYTVPEAAAELNIAVRTVHAVIQKMADSGCLIGNQRAPGCTTILTSDDLKAIKQWREEHPRGRPGVQSVRTPLAQTDKPY